MKVYVVIHEWDYANSAVVAVRKTLKRAENTARREMVARTGRTWPKKAANWDEKIVAYYHSASGQSIMVREHSLT